MTPNPTKMNPKRPCKLIACLLLLQIYLPAQDKLNIKFGKVLPEDFTLPASAIIDSNTNGVIIADVGATHFTGNKQGWFSYVFKRQTRIKVINKKAFDLATVEIPLYAKDDRAEKIENLSASTYNLENGKVIETKMGKTEAFDDKLDKNHFEKKFTLPAVKEGSIIEYSYTIISDFLVNIPEWRFQSAEYPCVWSEYEVEIPQLLSYVFVKHGIHDFCIDKSSEGHQSYMVVDKPETGSLVNPERNLSVSAITVKHHWAMKGIPAFFAESYLTTPKNYTDRLEFQLSQTYDGQDIHDYKNTWKKATEELLKQEDFGGPLREDNIWLNELLNSITGNISNELERAKAIYYYVSSHFTCTNHYNPYIKTSLRDVVKKKNGTIGDINLLLIALLRQQKIPADPVLLSTREYGFNLASYPVMDKLNAVICKTSINGHTYYLDATHPQLGFGQLPGNCYNGHARIISETDSGSVYFYADSLKEKKLTMVIISSNEKGVLEGNYQSTSGNLESYNIREKVNEKGIKDYFKNIQAACGDDVEISNTGIDSLNKPEDPLKVYYDFRLKQEGEIIYFNPMFAEAYHDNPFKAAERKYPVEMPYTFDDIYTLTMDIPAGYVVDELPKSAKVAFNGSEGIFEYLITKTENSIQFRCRVKLDRANFTPDDYPTLRDFFAYIVKKESEEIVLKKK